MQYESEDDNNPRHVLDLDGDAIILGPSLNRIIKLRDLERHVPYQGHFVVRPVPTPAVVRRVSRKMETGGGDVWAGTEFELDGLGDPMTVFAPQDVYRIWHGLMTRYVLRRQYVPLLEGGLKTMLMWSDGSCLGNGRGGPRAGWAFVFKPGHDGTFSGVLEQSGPDRQPYGLKSNRAELRAVIAALTCCFWPDEGWERIVIATDSQYVARGATLWLRRWATNGWRTANRTMVKNIDLWRRLSQRMGEFAQEGCETSFWHIPREQNTAADRAARQAAAESYPRSDYRDFCVQGPL